MAIKDKKVYKCACGKSNVTELRTAKRRVSSWLGYGALLGFIFVLITYPEFLITNLDVKAWALLLLVGYFLVGISVRTRKWRRQGHSFVCSTRRASLEVI